MNRKWVKSAIDFFYSLSALGTFTEIEIEIGFVAPLLPRDMERLKSRLPAIIPPPLELFFVECAASVTFHYLICNDLAGGGKICSAELPDRFDEMYGCGEALGNINKEISDRWKSSFPLIAMRNGDFIAFDMATNAENPPIIYLSHDEEIIRTLANCFEEFLDTWARINYAGPEIWDFEDWGFLNPETGLLTPDSPKMAEYLLQFNKESYAT